MSAKSKDKSTNNCKKRCTICNDVVLRARSNVCESAECAKLRNRIYQRNYRTTDGGRRARRDRQRRRRGELLKIKSAAAVQNTCLFCDGPFFTKYPNKQLVCASRECKRAAAQSRSSAYRQRHRDRVRRISRESARRANADPVTRAKKLEHARERRKDPVVGERIRERCKIYDRKRRESEEFLKQKRAYEMRRRRELAKESIEMQFILNPITEQPNETGTNQPE